MKSELMLVLYLECFFYGTTVEYRHYRQELIENITDERISEEEEDKLITAVDAECYNAFKAGFKTAVKLLGGEN